MKAEATFKHMYIYNPLERRMERLNSLEEHKTDEIYCSNAGSLLLDSEQALHLALGNLNPFSLKRLDNWHPERDALKSLSEAKNAKSSKHKSIWQSNFQEESPVKSKPKNNQASCAMFFKKIDFVGKTIDAEIEANQRQELAKQTEAELFSMYSCGGGKRKRSPSSSSSSSCGTPSSPATNKSRHNPFAKEIQRSPVVCENGSLLRLLSPKKQSSPLSSTDERTKPETTRVNAIKRSIFAKEQVEVRSRFFSTQTPELHVDKELKMENRSDTSVHCRHLQLESTESIAESEPDVNTNNNEPIVLLSSSSDDSSSQSATLPSSQEAVLPVRTIQKLPPSARRVGLSRPKTNKRTTATAKMGENQTKLSMFGFQKRPVLK